MCLYTHETEPCAICGLARRTGNYRKLSDCSDKDCPWSLYHPLSLYRNGYAIVHSDEGNLLLQSTFMQAKTAEGRMKLTMRVNVQQLAMDTSSSSEETIATHD
ncbi:hypothetical protein C8F01DRAFT_1232165 [Mycena amicta]|nr:hypothetical protein C8F01DRAFT_1232165 [Mycena amicta]